MAIDVLPRRFWKHVSITPDCWLWTGRLTAKGYGAYNVSGRSFQAHRAMLMHLGKEMPPNIFGCHKCDVRNCVRPDHLFLGTAQDNATDMARKGRSPRGQKHWQSKYTPDQIQEIRRLYREGMSAHAIGKHIGCGGGYVWQVLNGKLWAHLPEEVAA